MTDGRRRTVTGVMSQIDIVLAAVASLREDTAAARAENAEAHRDIDRRLHSMESSIAGVVATQREHGLAIERQSTSCKHRHARDTEEQRAARAVELRLAAIEQGSVHRAASRRDLWVALGGLAAIIGTAVGAAKLLLGG